MATVVLDALLEERLKAERVLTGADRFDEVWEGTYMMAPLANNEHQDLQLALGSAFYQVVVSGKLGRAHAGANVSDREDDWLHNYRCPDVVVVLAGGRARDCGTHWLGGPDFVAEIVSKGDQSRDKFDFYAGTGVRELLLIDRYPWQLELYRLAGDEFQLVGRSCPADAATLRSAVVPTSFRLLPADVRPQIEVTHHDGVQRWLI